MQQSTSASLISYTFPSERYWLAVCMLASMALRAESHVEAACRLGGPWALDAETKANRDGVALLGTDCLAILTGILVMGDARMCDRPCLSLLPRNHQRDDLRYTVADAQTALPGLCYSPKQSK